MSFASPEKNTRRLTGVATVVVLHVGLIYALANGLGHQVVEIIKSPLETRLIDEAKKPPEVPPPPPPKLAPPPPPFIPVPDFHVASPPPANAIRVVTTVKPAEPPPPPAPAPVIVAVAHVPPTADAAHPCAKPEYPSISRRLEETGTTALAFLVSEDGTVVDSKVESSSGSTRLDDAALAVLKTCRYKPGTANGKPEKAWAHVRYHWTLE